VNDVGKPCDREGHARFDGGREEPGASRLVRASLAPPAYATYGRRIESSRVSPGSR
jgi:hypothetical protein